MPVRRRGFSEPEKVWTDRDDTNGFFFPVVGGMDTAQIAGVRPAFEITHVTGSILIVPAFQLSDDGENWPDSATCSPIPSVSGQSTEGLYYHGAFETPTLDKKYVRWGFLVTNAAEGNTLELAQAALRLEFKRC